MIDRVFIDSNILIYAYSIDEPSKRKIAENLFEKHEIIIISTQTINEFINVTTRKKMLDHSMISSVINEFFEVFLVETVDQKVIQKAITIADKHRYSYFDSLMISSALTSKCSILYSEDMHHFHELENRLKIINPFHE